MIKIAWRNIWRNRRRALITMASVFFAAFFSILMISFQGGAFYKMIDNTLRTQAGHIQIHAQGYWEEKVTDNFMFVDSATLLRLEHIPNIQNVSPRLETFALASSESNSKGIAIVGISPQKEAEKSNLPSRMRKGAYLSENDDGILIGEGVASYLNVTVGDTLALIGQGYHGSSAAGLFPIRGVVKLITNEMDYGVGYVTLPSVQYFIDMPEGYSGILISILNNKRLDETVERICGLLLEKNNQENKNGSPEVDKVRWLVGDYEVLPWHITMERLLETEKSDRMIGVVVIFILYVIVGFGILGTVIMITNERLHEFCVMISIGMTRMKLSATIVLELLIMSFIGVFLAYCVTLPIAHWFHAHPIEVTGGMAEMFIDYGMEPLLPLSIEPSIFTNQITTVLVIVAVTLIYPVRKIMKLNISEQK